MKIKLLKISILLIMFMLICSNTLVLAVTVQSAFSGDTSEITGAVSATQEIVGTILDVVRLVGTGVGVIILTYIGIKFMTAAPSERANIKQYCMNFAIGAFILICGTNLLSVIKSVADKI